MEMKTAFLRPLNCWWLTYRRPPWSQGTISAELACGFLFLVTTKVAWPAHKSTTGTSLVWSAQQALGLPERSPQRISCGFVNPILFHFDLRQPFCLIWVRKYGLHRISTRHEEPELNTQRCGLEKGLCCVLCSCFFKKASREVEVFSLRSSFLVVALSLPSSARTDRMPRSVGSFKRGEVTCWRLCHLWDSAALGPTQKEKEVPSRQGFGQWVKFPERPAASQGCDRAPGSQ